MSLITFLADVGVDIAKATIDAARLAEGKYRQKNLTAPPKALSSSPSGWLAA